MSQHDLTDLGWSAFYMSQLSLDELDLARFRIAEIHRNRLVAFGPDGPVDLTTHDLSSGDITVGDWVLADQQRVTRLLGRKTLIQRRAAGPGVAAQLIAANVDALFIVTSCNADFNLRRLERYLALAFESDVEPVVILTKADLSQDAETYVGQAKGLHRRLEVIAIDARSPDVTQQLSPWCRKGQTVALAGSSGVGKTTLSNALTGATDQTAAIREDDARGRHTTTYRALHPLPDGGWIIDTPGTRELRLTDVGDGIDTLFEDITMLAATCRFTDCQHQNEPGCAIRMAIEGGGLDEDRLRRWEKLKREDRFNTETLHERTERYRAFGRLHNRLMKERDQWTKKR
ncbi:MAG: ribosome small subunit-dependent GTPase A [Deltaproteobacteria bacterium]